MKRGPIFFIALGYLSVILILGLLFFINRSWMSFVPDSFGPVPLGVPWFGALGAVLISLTGVFDHEHDWNDGFWPWHLARPLIGVGLGVVSVLILKAGILAVGSAPPPQPASIPSNLLYYLIAFLVGYREETFREMIKRLVDVVLAPTGTVPTIHLVDPGQAPHLPPNPVPVVIIGSGFSSTQSVKFGNSVAQFTINSDGQLTATAPNVPGAGPVALAVTTKQGSATHQFTFT